MESYIDYLNRELPDRNGNKALYKFKKKTLDEMTARANEISSRGLTDRRVLDDLVISEYKDLGESFKAFYEKETAAAKARRSLILNAVGSAAYLLLLVVAFLGVSFATKRWDMTWAIIVDGILLWVAYLLLIGTNFFAKKQKIFHIFARLFLMGAVILTSVTAFVTVVALTDLPRSWVILIFGLIAMFLCDALFATLHGHKLAIFAWLLYIPVISVFAFIIVGALGFMPWGTAWIIIPLSLIIDLVIIFAAIAKNNIHKTEVEDIWNEN